MCLCVTVRVHVHAPANVRAVSGVVRSLAKKKTTSSLVARICVASGVEHQVSEQFCSEKSFIRLICWGCR